MFTGIIESLGILVARDTVQHGSRITIEADLDLSASRIGDSIAVNGVCLTIVEKAGARFKADVSPETLARTTFKDLKRGARVNLERALRLSDRLDGHLVSGHIDGAGRLAAKKSTGNAIVCTVEVAAAFTRYMIEKGSVAVDGISLTINRVMPQGFEVSVIPHTAAVTTIGVTAPGGWVNIETDLIGKYIERFITTGKPEPSAPASGVDMQFLARTGFL